MEKIGGKIYRFGKFELHTDELRLVHENQELPLTQKTLKTLLFLVENQNKIVEREELLDAVWEDAMVEENVLSVNVSNLRKVFKENGDGSKFIKTFPRKGYQFVAEVEEILPESQDEVLIIEKRTKTEITFEETDDNKLSSDTIPKLQTSPKKSNNQRYLAIGLILSISLILIAGGVWQRYFAAKDANKINSIAVLPLKHLMETEENKPLSLGLTDNLISRLGSLNQFIVRPFSAVTKFDKSEKDAVKFGKDLQVDAVLTGTMQTVGGRLRVNVRLIKVGDGSQLWEGSFDETESDLFKLQDALSAQVAKSITSHLTEAEHRKLTANLTQNNEAYEAYLKGRYFWSKRTKDDLQRAITHYQKAIELDANFAEAYVGLADSQFLLFDYRWDDSLENPQKAKKNLLKALSIKSDSAIALSTLGLIQTSFDWDWQAAETSFQKALEIQPNSSQALLRYGSFLIRMRRFPEAQKMLAEAKKLDPLSVGINMNYAASFLHAKKLEVAENQLKETLEIVPNFTPASWYLGRAYWQQNRKVEAVNEFIQTLEKDGETEAAIKMRQTDGDVLNKIRVWRVDWVEKLRKGEKDAHDLAIVSALLEDKEATLSYLEKSVEDHDVWASWINAESEFDFVRNEERFIELLKKMEFVDGG